MEPCEGGRAAPEASFEEKGLGPPLGRGDDVPLDPAAMLGGFDFTPPPVPPGSFLVSARGILAASARPRRNRSQHSYLNNDFLDLPVPKHGQHAIPSNKARKRIRNNGRPVKAAALEFLRGCGGAATLTQILQSSAVCFAVKQQEGEDGRKIDVKRLVTSFIDNVFDTRVVRRVQGNGQVFYEFNPAGTEPLAITPDVVCRIYPVLHPHTIVYLSGSQNKKRGRGDRSGGGTNPIYQLFLRLYPDKRGASVESEVHATLRGNKGVKSYDEARAFGFVIRAFHPSDPELKLKTLSSVDEAEERLRPFIGQTTPGARGRGQGSLLAGSTRPKRRLTAPSYPPPPGTFPLEMPGVPLTLPGLLTSSALPAPTTPLPSRPLQHRLLRPVSLDEDGGVETEQWEGLPFSAEGRQAGRRMDAEAEELQGLEDDLDDLLDDDLPGRSFRPGLDAEHTPPKRADGFSERPSPEEMAGPLTGLLGSDAAAESLAASGPEYDESTGLGNDSDGQQEDGDRDAVPEAGRSSSPSTPVASPAPSLPTAAGLSTIETSCSSSSAASSPPAFPAVTTVPMATAVSVAPVAPVAPAVLAASAAPTAVAATMAATAAPTAVTSAPLAPVSAGLRLMPFDLLGRIRDLEEIMLGAASAGAPVPRIEVLEQHCGIQSFNAGGLRVRVALIENAMKAMKLLRNEGPVMWV